MSSGQDVVEVMLALHQVLHIFHMNVKYCRTKLQFKHLVSSWEVGNRHCMHPHSGWYCHVKVTDVHLLLLPECDGKTFHYCNISKKVSNLLIELLLCAHPAAICEPFLCVLMSNFNPLLTKNKVLALKKQLQFPNTETTLTELISRWFE